MSGRYPGLEDINHSIEVFKDGPHLARSGSNIRLYVPEDPSNREIVLFIGGCGDPNSLSPAALATELFIESNGEIITGVVGTYRPMDAMTALWGVARAREQRARSLKYAITTATDAFDPSFILPVGHSHGGVTLTDTAEYMDARPEHSEYIDRVPHMLGIDVPGAFGKETDVPHAVVRLLQLFGNVLPDVAKIDIDHELNRSIPAYEWYSVYEWMYMARELLYLRNSDLKKYDDILPMTMSFMTHAFDVVKGALSDDERNIPHEQGGHLHAITEPRHTIRTILSELSKTRNRVAA